MPRVQHRTLRPYLLLLLKESDAHGYDLLERLASLKVQADAGNVYRTLAGLETAGLVRSWWDKGSTGHGRHVYQLTEEGEKQLNADVAEMRGDHSTADQFLQRHGRLLRRPVGSARRGGRKAMPAPTPTQGRQDGLLRFIHYGFMPNRLGYCGPDRNASLFDYGAEGVVDPELAPLLTRFLGPTPYLKTIAAAAGIADVFDDRVVEAYWLGNDLLERIDARELYSSLKDRYRMDLSPRVMDLVAGKVPQGARPHHSFHVFDVWRQAGRLDGNVIATMDNCRISWGTVQAVEGPSVRVGRQPLVMREGKLGLEERPQVEIVTRLHDGKGFVAHLEPGDIVSIHWGWVCELLDHKQARALERYTRYHMELANLTI